MSRGNFNQTKLNSSEFVFGLCFSSFLFGFQELEQHLESSQSLPQHIIIQAQLPQSQATQQQPQLQSQPMPQIQQEKPTPQKKRVVRKQANLSNDNGEATSKKRRTIN